MPRRQTLAGRKQPVKKRVAGPAARWRGRRQVDADPPLRGLVCFGKVGLKEYRERMRELFSRRRGQGKVKG